jgi:hypothetical protein
MAVQPDKRPWQELLVANGWDETERHRIGIWTLTAPRIDHTPSSFRLRCDRPGFPKGTNVSWLPHDGWVIYDGEAQFASRSSPAACLDWWVSRHSA